MLLDQDFAGTLLHVPEVDLPFDGDCAQAIGVEVPIAVINLARRPDRWDAVSRRMAGVGLDNLIRVPAFEGASLSLEAITRLLGPKPEAIDSPPSSHLALTRPAIGCFLSHLAIWRWMIDNRIPRMLVFEDDAQPGTHFAPARFRALLGERADEHGLVLLGHIIMNGMAEDAQGSDLARVYYFNSTAAYLITPAACQFLIPRLLPMNRHIDHQISQVLIDNRHIFSAWYAAPALFEPDWSLQSDCYVPLREETDADRAFGALLTANRDLLLREGRPLIAPAT